MLLSMCPDAKGRWSGNILVKYEYSTSQMFDSILDGCYFLLKFVPDLNEHGAKTQAEPNCDQLCYGGTFYCTPTDAPLNMMNETDGRRETQRLRENISFLMWQSDHKLNILNISSFDRFVYELRGARVEQYYAGSWSTVCDDGWDLNNAKVVCRQLGLGGAVRATTGSFFGQGTGRAILSNVDCTSSETGLDIFDRYFLPKFDPNLNEHGAKTQAELNYDQLCYGGTFYYTPTDAPFSMINDTDGRREIQRLRENDSPFILHSGHYLNVVELPSIDSFFYKLRGADVEQFYTGSWNSVTVDDDWELNDAEVVCRQLGLGGAVRATTGFFFGRGTGRALLSNVDCTSSETGLGWCLHSGWIRTSCSQTASVFFCEGKVQ